MLERLSLRVEKRKIREDSFFDRIIEEAIELAGISKGDKVAEIGCDQNIIPALVLASVCDAVYAIDKDYDRLEVYKRRLLEFRSQSIKKIRPITARAEELPFEENSLDGIVFYRSFGWISALGSVAGALRSTHDSLKLGKYAISIEYSLKDADEREKMFRDIGFTVERYGNIVLGKKILEKALDISSKKEYLGFTEELTRETEELITREKYEEVLEAIRRDGERTREVIRKDGEKIREERRSL